MKEQNNDPRLNQLGDDRAAGDDRHGVRDVGGQWVEGTEGKAMNDASTILVSVFFAIGFLWIVYLMEKLSGGNEKGRR